MVDMHIKLNQTFINFVRNFTNLQLSLKMEFVGAKSTIISKTKLEKSVVNFWRNRRTYFSCFAYFWIAKLRVSINTAIVSTNLQIKHLILMWMKV